jgi:hypothetical protein
MTREGLTEAGLAEALSEQLPTGYGYTQVAVNHWLNNRRSPEHFRMHYLATHATGWVRDFATDALAAIDLDVEQRR